MSGVAIKVKIAGREYPLKVSPGEHKKVLEVEEEIQSKINELQENYGVRDKQDLLAMSLLQFKLTEAHQKGGNVDESLIEKLQDLESFVSDYLKSK